MRLIVLGLNHKSAPVATREAFAVPGEAVVGLDRRVVLEPLIAEAMMLSTCNRVELYAVAESSEPDGLAAARDALVRVLANERGLDPTELTRYGYSHMGIDAARHLIRVCASLDSLVVGEAQIMAQVKEAYQSAKEAGSIGPVLEQVVQAGFRGGKAVRTDTDIASESVSIGSVAVELAKRIFPSLARCQVLVIGAGKMGRVTARSLARAGVAEVVVTNRSPARAEKLAQELGWVARPFADLDELLVKADVVLTCTGADRPILDQKRLRAIVKRRKYRPLFIVDIAVPRDVEPSVADLEQVFLYNIDDLEAVSREHLEKRQGEAGKAEAIVEATLTQLRERHGTQTVVPVLRALRERLDTIARGELEKVFQRRLQHLGPAEREAIEAVLQATLNKVMHPAMTALREHAQASSQASGHAPSFDLPSAARVLYGLDTTEAEVHDAVTATATAGDTAVAAAAGDTTVTATAAAGDTAVTATAAAGDTAVTATAAAGDTAVTATAAAATAAAGDTTRSDVPSDIA